MFDNSEIENNPIWKQILITYSDLNTRQETSQFTESGGEDGPLMELVRALCYENNLSFNRQQPLLTTEVKYERYPQLPNLRIHMTHPAVTQNDTLQIIIVPFIKAPAPQKPPTIEDLIKEGTLNREIADLLVGAYSNRFNIIIGGGTGTGKTTLLSSIVSHCSPRSRTIMINDVDEYDFSDERVVTFRPSVNKEISRFDLLRSADRMRPDSIVEDEIRDPTIFAYVQNTGSHYASTIHLTKGATDQDIWDRLNSAIQLTDKKFAKIDKNTIIVQMERDANGKRYVSHVYQVIEYTLRHLYEIVDIENRIWEEDERPPREFRRQIGIDGNKQNSKNMIDAQKIISEHVDTTSGNASLTSIDKDEARKMLDALSTLQKFFERFAD